MSVSSASTPWDRIPPRRRWALVFGLWLVTWVGLVAGLFRPGVSEAVVAFSVAHAGLVLVLNRFRLGAFPVQVRLGYLAWVALGTYVPSLRILLSIAIIGLLANLLFDYCLLARTTYLLPWNRREALSWGLVRRVLLTPPAPGRFRPTPST